MSDSYWLIVVLTSFYWLTEVIPSMMPGHVATCRPEVLSPGQEMRFFMITRHHTGDGKYFEPIVHIMTEGVLRLALINIGTIHERVWADAG